MRLLLDEHMPPAVATGLQRDGIDAVALPRWLGGTFRSAADARLLEVASAENRTLVTDDRKTVPRLLTAWAETGQHHAGVVLIDERTVRQNDIGGLLRSLRALIARAGDWDWQDRVMYLPVP